MFRRLDDFWSAFESNCQATEKILATLTDANINQCVADGHRTLGHIAWHIVTTVPEMMAQTGLPLSSIDHKSLPPASAAEIIAGYKAVSSELAESIKKDWTDDTLEQTDEMYGMTWARGQTLAVLMNHEVHHRGQMTILLRQADAKVPGVYGPSKEEWSQYGMDEPPY